jgi:hypothetical protein
MRTTIEIRDEHRAKLLEMAARRGEKGFSRLVGEAIEAFLAAQSEDDERCRRALAVKGSLGGEASADLRQRAHEIRETWR